MGNEALRVPHARTRVAVATLLGRDAAELWPEPYRRRDLPWFRPWAELEQDATAIRSYQPLLVPGLLQTEGYARAMLRTGNLLPPAEVEEIVVSRLARQSVLRREGDRDVMYEQFTHLAALAEEPHVQVRVIPAEVPWHTGLAGPFVLARLPDLSEVAYLDNQLRGELVTDRGDLVSLGRRWESVTGEAFPRRRSIELVREVAQTWR